MSFWKWSRTAATNATADGSINWAEGQPPSSVNDSARAMMAAASKYRDDIAGAIATGGTSTAYTVTSYQVFDTLANMNGAMIAFTPHVTNGATVTLNVDGLGAKALRSAPSVELPSNSLIVGTPYVATYYNATTEWILQGGLSNPYNIPLAGGLDYWAATAPNSAFALPYGQAISRTTYASLFTLIGTTFGTGDGSTTFNLPDKRGRLSTPGDTLGGGSNVGYIGLTAVGQTGGVSSNTLAFNNMPTSCPWTGSFSTSGTTALSGSTHTHPFTGTTDSSGSHSHQSNDAANKAAAANGGSTFSAWSGSTTSVTSTDGAHTHPFSGTTGNNSADHGHTFNLSASISFGANVGGGQSFSNLPPLIVCNYILRVL